jgi:hypothetical protein
MLPQVNQPRLHLPCPSCGQKVALAVWPVVKFACAPEQLQWDVSGHPEPFEQEEWPHDDLHHEQH